MKSGFISCIAAAGIGFAVVGQAATYGNFIDAKDLQTEMRAKAQAPWFEVGLPLLRPFLLNSPSPGLFVVGAADADEIRSTKKFAEILHREYGLNLILISRWAGLDVPGFDGVVVDQDKKVIANFSLKRLLGANQTSYTNAVIKGFNRIDDYSQVRSWVQFLQFISTWGKSKDAFGEPVARYSFASEKEWDSFNRLERTSMELVSLFAPETDRPRWMFVDSTARELSLDQLRSASYLTEEAGRTILAINRKIIVTMHAGSSRIESLNLCEGDFASEVPPLRAVGQ